MLTSGLRPDLVVYEIYLRSFYDTNGDGVGDLRGVIQKLDYLASLGINTIWLTPFYPSPMADFGYDVADYCTVDPLFGTLDDFKLLVESAHKSDLRILIDFVPNHSSDEHPWFVESRSSRANSKRGWYVWRDPKPDGSPPNNWRSIFGGSAWEFDELTGQYYLHSFLAKQPDLNWDNPEVRKALKNVMKFWLELGVDGFRVDSVDWLSKNSDFKDEPLNLEYNTNADDPYLATKHISCKKGPHLYEYLQEIADVISKYPERFMLVEAHVDSETQPEKFTTSNLYLTYYEHVDPQVSAPINFNGLFLPWTAQSFKIFIDYSQASLHDNDLPIYCLGNHDRSRLASRTGREAARAAAMMLLTLPGIPIMYYGDELGMVDAPIPTERVQDPYEKNVPGKGLGRDPERTPLQWNGDPNAGFTLGKPWLPISPDYKTYNIEAELADPSSLLNLYRQLLALRNRSGVLRHGSYKPLDLHPDIFGYIRKSKNEKFAIILNFSGQELITRSPLGHGKVIQSTYMDKPSGFAADNALTLRPHEGLILQLSD